MTPLEAITCATKNAAKAMRKENILGLHSGYKADLLVIDGDLFKDVSLLGKRN